LASEKAFLKYLVIFTYCLNIQWGASSDFNPDWFDAEE